MMKKCKVHIKIEWFLQPYLVKKSEIKKMLNNSRCFGKR